MKKAFIKRILKGSVAKAKGFFADKRIMAVLLILCCLGVTSAYAQDPFAEASGKILAYKESVKNLIYAIAAVIGIVGAFNIFHKMQNGDQDVKKTIMMTLGGCIALVVLAQALPAFFGQ